MSLNEAKNLQTKPSRLAYLATSEDKEILREVAKNPSTPLETLLVLAEECPKEFLQNEALPFFLLETPNLLHSLTKNAAIALLTTQTLPSFARKSLANHPIRDVRWAVAEDENTPQTLLELLAKDEDYDIRAEVARNLKTPQACLEELAKDVEPFVRFWVAENPNTPLSLLGSLATDVDQVVRKEAKAARKRRKET